MGTIPAQEVLESLHSQLLTPAAREGQEYARVTMLNFYWSDGEAGFKKEADDLKELFTAKFNYEVINYAIPPEKGQCFVNKAISDVIANSKDDQQLIIIHYGGHGVGRNHNIIWLSEPPKGDFKVDQMASSKEIDWSEVQNQVLNPIVDKDKQDVLVILDCCSAASAMRSQDSEQTEAGRFEIIAATAEYGKTPMPGEASFTFKLMKRLGERLEEQQPISARGLVTELADHKKFGLFSLPIHHPRRENKYGPIVLQPLSATRSGPPKQGTSFGIVVKLDDFFSEEAREAINIWIQQAPPQLQRFLAMIPYDRRTIRQDLDSEVQIPQPVQSLATTCPDGPTEMPDLGSLAEPSKARPRVTTTHSCISSGFSHSEDRSWPLLAAGPYTRVATGLSLPSSTNLGRSHKIKKSSRSLRRKKKKKEREKRERKRERR